MSKRILALALFHQSSFSREQFKKLEQNAVSAYQAHFGDDYRITFIWLEIPSGQAYIAGKPSTATTITMPVTDGTSDQQRHAFMSSFCQMWMQETSCSENEIILSVMDKRLSSHYTKASLARFNPDQRKSQLLKLVGKILFNKLTKGRFQLSINLG